MMLVPLSLSTALALGPRPEDCVGLTMVEPYTDLAAQFDFLANYPALATTFSPLHGPVPGTEGHGQLGLELAFIPPLGCGRLYVGDFGAGPKYEDANKTPVVPRPRVSYVFPELPGNLLLYGGVAFVPSVPVGGTRNVSLSTELGVGRYFTRRLSLGLRGHASLLWTVGDVAEAVHPDEPAVADVYLGASTGADLLVGLRVGGLAAEAQTSLEPYLALGVLETSTFFWVGDDSVVTTNHHPYLGPAGALGADLRVLRRVHVVGELYAAPGGHGWATDADGEKVTDTVEASFGRYGHLVTGRLRLALDL